MDKVKEAEWRDAYYAATTMVGARRLETAVLAIGIMFQKTVEESIDEWFNRMKRESEEGRR